MVTPCSDALEAPLLSAPLSSHILYIREKKYGGLQASYIPVEASRAKQKKQVVGCHRNRMTMTYKKMAIVIVAIVLLVSPPLMAATVESTSAIGLSSCNSSSHHVGYSYSRSSSLGARKLLDVSCIPWDFPCPRSKPPTECCNRGKCVNGKCDKGRIWA
jgi:hypothetical protein